ncbi:hypothetical protein ACUSIJ_11110 [Pseudochelatococcus sp. B33]
MFSLTLLEAKDFRSVLLSIIAQRRGKRRRAMIALVPGFAASARRRRKRAG